MCEKESRGLERERKGRGRERRQYGRQACLHSISPSSITLNRKVIDYETRAEQGRAERRAVTPARMQTTLDMLILPTSSNNQQSAKQHSWTLFHFWLKSRFEMEMVQLCRRQSDSFHINLRC